MRRELFWSFAAQAVGLVIPPLLLLTLARILEPSDFGIFALLTITIITLQSVILEPLGQVIIRSEQESVVDFVFTLQFVVGLIFCLSVWWGAEFISGIFNEPSLASPLRVGCVMLLLGPVIDTAIKLNMRQMNFKVVFVRRAVSPVANALVAIPLALFGAGYWALVWGQISGMLMACMVVLFMGDWRPHLNIKYRQFGDELSFSGQMLLQGLVKWIRSQSDKAILGWHFPSQSLGSYDIARRLAGLPFASIVMPVAHVMYATMSDRIRRGIEVKGLFLTAQRRLLMITLPLSIILFINSKSLIAILLGPNWAHIDPVFSLMVIVGALSSLVGFNMEVFKAKNKPHIMTYFMLMRGAATLITFLIAAPHGIFVLALAVVGLGVFFSPINVFITLKLLGITVSDYLTNVCFRPAIVAIAVALFNLFFILNLGENMIATTINVFAGGGIMFASLAYWERDVFIRRAA